MTKEVQFNARRSKRGGISAGGGKSAAELVRQSNRWRDNYNPIRGLVIARAIYILESADRGDFPELQLVMRKIERRFPVLKGLKARRLAALEKLDWEIRIVDQLPDGVTRADAEAQQAFLRSRYELIENLTEAIAFLATAEFRGYAILQKHRFNDGGQFDGAVRELHWLPQDQFSRNGQFGDFFYNQNSTFGAGIDSCLALLGESNRIGSDELPREDFIIREVESPLYEIALIAFVNWAMGRKDWAAFTEIFGLPNGVAIMPANIPPGMEDEYRTAAERVADGISGALPNGSDIKFPTAGVRGKAPFKDFCDAQDADVVLAGTGGRLAMLTADKGGLGNGPALEHASAFDEIAQALQKMLELSPRTGISFDYSTTPPTIYVRSVDNFAPAALPLFNGVDHKSLNIKRRDDLIARAVIITYRFTNTIDGHQKIDYAVDKWGPHGSNSSLDPSTGLRVICETIDLQGYNVTTTTALLDCEPLACIGGTNATKRGWWSSRRGGEQAKFIDSRVRFQDSAFAEVTIPDATISYATTGGIDSLGTARIAGSPLTAPDVALFTNRIVSGSHHPWMASGANPVYALKVRVSVKMEFATYDLVATGDAAGQLPADESASNTAVNGARNGKVNTEEIHCELILTNATNAGDGSPFTASTVASSTPGEAAIVGPGGIAQYLFNALQPFQYDGEYVKVESDFANNVSLTNAINFTGGRAEWAIMNAQPQSILKDYGTKETFVQIGVARHLTAGQLSSLLNMWAFRRTWYNPALRADNSVASGGLVTMPDATPSANATGGVANHNDLVTTEYATPGDPMSDIKGQVKATAQKISDILAATTPTPAAAFSATDIKTNEPRECVFCAEDGSIQYGIVMTTGFYTKP